MLVDGEAPKVNLRSLEKYFRSGLKYLQIDRRIDEIVDRPTKAKGLREKKTQQDTSAKSNEC